MKKISFKNFTTTSYLSLATLPLFKENINSFLIIITAILTIINFIGAKKKKTFKIKYWPLTILFWMFLFHEILSQDFNFSRVLVYLPFLIFPLIFYFKPNYIDYKTKEKSIIVFQLSTILQISIYLFLFLYNQPLTKLFYTRQNVPFFREYVSGNYLFEIHPTYFSSFLLISFTISMFKLFSKKQKYLLFNIFNILLMVFFVFLFASRIIIIILLLTIFIMPIYFALKGNRKQVLVVFLSILSLLILLIIPQKDIFERRFNELKTEINNPIINDYHNSTNIRVAILKCGIILIKNVPSFGYGEELQKKLNECYKENNDSNFYELKIYNTHNYYIYLIAYGGWMFFLLFFMYVFFVYKNIKYSTLGIFILTQILMINLTENYFSRHYGIVLFSYLTALLIFVESKKINEQS